MLSDRKLFRQCAGIVACHAKIDAGCRDVRMAEKLLHRREVLRLGVEVCRFRAPDRVRRIERTIEIQELAQSADAAAS